MFGAGSIGVGNWNFRVHGGAVIVGSWLFGRLRVYVLKMENIRSRKAFGGDWWILTSCFAMTRSRNFISDIAK